ncbi:MAG: YggS family pyridoxal phosphate-dependent enzyme [Chloroflexota bacterium]
MSELIEQLAERYESVQKRIAWAAERAQRTPGEITLVAVTKTFPAEVVIAAYELGMRHFGENRAGELAEKRSQVEAELGPNSGITWHLIGPLQSRKTTLAADNADYFHALDRIKIARRLSDRLQETGRTLPVLIEVNVSGEESKHGFDATRWEEDEQQRRRLQEVAQDVAGRPGLDLRGLMTMAPWDAEPDVLQGVFRRTHALATWLEQVAPEAQWTDLSMGMTDDFELAIEQGATHVRVGRAIFGPRQY